MKEAKILVLNCGSSSVKYKLFDMSRRKVTGSGGVEKVGMKGSFLKHTNEDGKQVILKAKYLNIRWPLSIFWGF